MTNEQNTVENAIQEVSVAAPVVNTEVETVSEKMLPQSKVNEIVGATKKSAYEKAYSDAKSEFEAKSSDFIRDSVKKEIETFANQAYEIEQKKEQETLAKKTIESLQSKVDEASKKYDDFNEVTGEIPYGHFPDLLVASDAFDNAGDVLYHIGKNPSKFRELAAAFTPGNPLKSMAIKELKQISESLKNSEAARQKGSPRAPLSQIKASSIGVDSGKKSITELRKKYTV